MKNWLVTCAVIGLSGCAATSQPIEKQTTTQVERLKASQPLLSGESLTLKQIMADPSWMGTAPVAAGWSNDSESIFYQIKQNDSPLYDGFSHTLSGQVTKLALSQQHLLAQQSGVLSQDDKFKAFTFQGNMFVVELATNQIKQLTKDNVKQSNPLFLSDGRLAYQQASSLYAIDLSTGLSELLADVKFAKAPSAPKTPSTYIGSQQHRLIKYVALQQHNKAAKYQNNQQLAEQNQTIASQSFYLDPSQSLVEFSLSPSGEHLLVVTKDKAYSWRAKHDMMPNYLGNEGYVEAVNARSRVAEDNPPAHQLVLLDLKQRTQTKIELSGLPGYHDDVLASVKQENHAKHGKEYQTKSSPRQVRLMQDWGWDQSAIAWNDNGSELAIMFEAIDNKDRWLTHYSFSDDQLKTLHRLHDDAWVNYTFNEFGWLNDNQSLYFLSEQSGYSQLYRTDLAGNTRSLTQGQFEVSHLTLSHDGDIYYKANKAHPGQYEIHRVNLKTAKSQQLTDLKGMSDYQLSPNQQKILIKHSSLLRHSDLYIKNSDGSGSVNQLTHTVSKEFAQYDWQAPQIVAVPSSHGEQPVYAKVYYPQGYNESQGKKYPAVIFNHGAGYLQNSHYGWSGYFREFMFHNLLAQQGYVVMDMDYRASKGYGRDWRTAIYRQMGTPEIEDLADGVNYLAKYLNVDSKRVGTYGGSYGGFMTFMALFTQPDLFQAGAALRPVTDWSHYNHGYTSNILNTPNDDDIAYRRSSPIEHAQHLTKPLLIMSGVLDDNVFFQDSVRLVQRLIELEKPMFETAIYPVEPHGFRQPSSWLDEYRRIYKLFEQHLK